MKIDKILFLSLLLTFFINFNAKGEEIKKDCSQIKNFYKKMVCKTNNATSTITNKKTLADFFPDGILKKKK